MSERQPCQPTGLHITHQHPSLRLNELALGEVLLHALQSEKKEIGFLSIVLADHETVLELNRRYLDHDFSTDVLAFPLAADMEDTISGEIYVDLDTAAARHPEFDASFEEEAVRYVLHGLLHLIGYEDKTPDGKSAMHEREDAYLRPLS